jgi:transcriptional regulator with XRE-family HTH domain
MNKIDKADFKRAKVHANVKPGESLKMLRELQGFSQNDLAQMTGISQSNISSLESGARQMGRERALVFAKALHVHPSVILFPDFDINQVA